jgi:ADP-ribose pyrophosphatase YjhB (NUDIX family)
MQGNDRLCTRCAAIIVNGERLLLAEHADATGETCLTFPGGLKHDDETEEECAARQALEETGLRVQIEALAYEVCWELPMGRRCEYYFVARPEGGDLRGDADPANFLGEPRQLVWVEPERLVDIACRPTELMYRLPMDAMRRFAGAPYPPSFVPA